MSLNLQVLNYKYPNSNYGAHSVQSRATSRLVLCAGGEFSFLRAACCLRLPSPQPLQLVAGRTELSREEEPCWCAWPLYLAHRPMRVHQYAELWDELRIRTRRRRSSIEPKTPTPSKSPRSRPPFLNYGSASDLHCYIRDVRERELRNFSGPSCPGDCVECGARLLPPLVLTQPQLVMKNRREETRTQGSWWLRLPRLLFILYTSLLFLLWFSF